MRLICQKHCLCRARYNYAHTEKTKCRTERPKDTSRPSVSIGGFIWLSVSLVHPALGVSVRAEMFASSCFSAIKNMKWILVQFLVATKRLYKRVCPSVGPSVRPSVRPWVGDAFAFWLSSFRMKSDWYKQPPKNSAHYRNITSINFKFELTDGR